MLLTALPFSSQRHSYYIQPSLLPSPISPMELATNGFLLEHPLRSPVFNEKQGRSLCWAARLLGSQPQTETLSAGQLQASRFCPHPQAPGLRHLSSWVSSQDRDCAEGCRDPCSHSSGPQQKLRMVEMLVSLPGIQGVLVMSKDLCCHLGVRDESRSCLLVRPHSLLRETDPQSQAQEV